MSMWLNECCELSVLEKKRNYLATLCIFHDFLFLVRNDPNKQILEYRIITM